MNQMERAHADAEGKKPRGSISRADSPGVGGKKAGGNLLPRHPPESHSCNESLSVMRSTSGSDSSKLETATSKPRTLAAQIAMSEMRKAGAIADAGPIDGSDLYGGAALQRLPHVFIAALIRGPEQSVSQPLSSPPGLCRVSHFTQRSTTPIHAKAAWLGGPGTRWAKLFRPIRAGFCAVRPSVATRR